MICDPIPFELVQKNLPVGGHYEPIMGICGKIFMTNLHNLQMLFMLRIKNKFSECLTPCAKMKAPMEDFLATVLPKPVDTVGYSGEVTPNLFCALHILLCSEKFVSNM